jgi:hypothetical protein
MRIHDPEPSFQAEDVLCLQETDKALLCLIDGEETWVPQSQILEDSEVYAKGHEGTLVVTKWFAHKKGWY